MNNKLKRVLSSVLAFVMLLSCMMVVNVSSVVAADTKLSVTSTDKLSGTAPETAENCTVTTATNSVTYEYDFSKMTGSETEVYGLTLKNFNVPSGTFSDNSSDKSSIVFTTDGSFTMKVTGSSLNKVNLNGSAITSDSSATEWTSETKTASTYTLSRSSSGATITKLSITLESSGGETDPTTYTIQLGDYDKTTYPDVTLDKSSTTTKGDAVTATWNENTSYQAGSKKITLTDDMLSGTTYTIPVEVSGENAWFTAIPVSQTATISITNNGGTVSGIDTTTSYTVGSTVSFTVTAPTGKVIDKVTANDKTLTATDGTYSFTVAETNSVVITYKDEESSSGTGTSYVHNFTKSELTSDFYTFTDCSTSDSKGSVTYNGSTLTKCLKMESKTTVSFTASAAGTLTLVFGGSVSASNQTVKVDGTSYTIDSTQILTLDVATGAHTITKGDSINLFYIDFTENGTSDTPATSDTTVTVYNSKGDLITTPLYYWTTLEELKDGKETNEYMLKDTNGVINVTEIAAGNINPTGDSTDSTNTPASDMSEVIADGGTGIIYVTAEGYIGAPVTLKKNDNAIVVLSSLPSADNIVDSENKYMVTPSMIINAILVDTNTNYSYKNPYLTSTTVNGFAMKATGADQTIKVMSIVNTRNSDVTANPYVQLAKGCTITYTPEVSGSLTIYAASPNSTTTRGYEVTGDGFTTVTQAVGTGKANEYTTYSVSSLKEGKTYTITITNTDEESTGGININSITFKPDEAVKYPLTYAGTDATITIGDGTTDFVSGKEYPEDTSVTITAKKDDNGNEPVVTVNGSVVELVANDDSSSYSYTFTLSQETEIGVTYNEADVTDKLVSMSVGDAIVINDSTDLVAKNTAYTGSNKLKYYADAVSGSGKANVIRLKANDSTNYIEFIAGEAGNIAVNFFNGNLQLIDVTDGDSTVLAKSDISSGTDVTRTVEVEAGHTYRLVATGDSNAYVNSIALVASVVTAGKNIVSVKDTEDVTNSAIITAYLGEDAATPAKAIRIIGQLSNITSDGDVTNVNKVGIALIDCDFETFKGYTAEEKLNNTKLLKITTVYPDLYVSESYDPTKDVNGVYTGTTMGLSPINTYFDVLVYGEVDDFNAKSYCTFTELNDGSIEFYDSDAQLCGADFKEIG